MSNQLDPDWPVWLIAVYLIVKDGLPLLTSTINKTIGIVAPAKAKHDQAELEFEKELEARRIDLREREVIALEQIGKSLVILDTKIQHQDQSMGTLLAGVSAANSALMVILDRVHRRREDYQPAQQAPAPSSPELPQSVSS